MRASTGGRARLLVVEDNAGDVGLLRMALQHARLDCELIIAEDGAKALDYIRSRGVPLDAPDLAIIDLNLPKHDGFELLEAIQRSSAWADVPVLVFSSSPYADNRKKLDFLRAVRFRAKPPDLDEYLEIGLVVREMLAEWYGLDRAAEGR